MTIQREGADAISGGLRHLLSYEAWSSRQPSCSVSESMYYTYARMSKAFAVREAVHAPQNCRGRSVRAVRTARTTCKGTQMLLGTGLVVPDHTVQLLTGALRRWWKDIRSRQSWQEDKNWNE
jgi:hypothetical protein